MRLCCRSFRLVIAAVTGFTVGCATPTTSNTARTAVEQLLISNAVDQSLDKVDFTPFSGQAVHLSETYIESVDKPYVVGSVRHRLLTAGALLVDKPEDADVIVEIRSGGIGTNTSKTFVGVPEVTLPGMLTLPELKFAERANQRGMAKLGLVAYDAKTHRVLGSGGMALSESTDSNWFIGGIGPFQGGTIKDEIKRSTTGPASYQRTRVPPQVAFATPQSASPAAPGKLNDIQFTSGSDSENE